VRKRETARCRGSVCAPCGRVAVGERERERGASREREREELWYKVVGHDGAVGIVCLYNVCPAEVELQTSR